MRQKRHSPGGGTAASPPQRLAFKGNFYTHMWKGQMVARKWPRKRGPPTSEVTKLQNQRFKDVIEAIKVLPADDLAALHEMSIGTAYTWRDLAFMLITGELVSIEILQMANIQEMLDTITPTVGAILVRGVEGWIGLQLGEVNQVVGAVGSETPPAYIDQAGGGGAGAGGYLAPALGTPPIQADLGTITALNLGTATITDEAIGIHIIGNQTANQVSGMKWPVPTPPYKFAAYIDGNTWTANVGIAVFLGWTDGTKFTAALAAQDGGSISRLYVISYPNLASGGAPAGTHYNSGGFPIKPLGLVLEDDGTNVKFGIIPNGVKSAYRVIFQQAKAGAYLANWNNFFFGINKHFGGNAGALIHWEQF